MDWQNNHPGMSLIVMVQAPPFEQLVVAIDGDLHTSKPAPP